MFTEGGRLEQAQKEAERSTTIQDWERFVSSQGRALCIVGNAGEATLAGDQMKISFNEQNIHTMFEYPSENSLAEDTGEEETNEASGSDSEEEDKPLNIFPRAKFVNSGGSNHALRANSTNSGLSSYTPKHSMEYSKWQEKNYEEKPSPDRPGPQEDMLTPADSDSRTDFRSEPALYF
ncbi:taperin [Discoglossus pictus]